MNSIQNSNRIHKELKNKQSLSKIEPYFQVKYDEDRRYPRMEHILQAVRCQYLTPSFLKEQMNSCTVLKKVPACREYLAKIFKVIYHLLQCFMVYIWLPVSESEDKVDKLKFFL